MFKLVKKQTKPVTLLDHFNRRNKVLIRRRAGGFGDILMQRMMFEDFSKTGLEFTHSCPYSYLELARNHPYVKAIELSEAKEENFGTVLDITSACRAYEMKYAPPKKHRSDIWAEYCGITLENHNMFLTPLPIEVIRIQATLAQINPEKKPIVLLATKSTNDEFGIGKSLTFEQIAQLVQNIRNMGMIPISIHDLSQDIYTHLGVQQYSLAVQDWIAMVSQVDYIISIDTSTFHMAGGLKKPLVGVFTFTDGKVYGKYYDFILVQKHRDNGNWDCGPCFMHGLCPKEQQSCQKPCLTELSADEITQGLCSAIKKWPFRQNVQKTS